MDIVDWLAGRCASATEVIRKGRFVFIQLSNVFRCGMWLRIYLWLRWTYDIYRLQDVPNVCVGCAVRRARPPTHTVQVICSLCILLLIWQLEAINHCWSLVSLFCVENTREKILKIHIPMWECWMPQQQQQTEIVREYRGRSSRCFNKIYHSQ